MDSTLLHIYGSFGIQAYGVCIAIALSTFFYLLKNDMPLKQLMTNEQLFNALNYGIIAGIVGARILFIMQHANNFTYWHEYVEFWKGGFSVLGSVIGVLLTVLLFLKLNNISVLPVLDRVALFAPILQGLSRIGCFFAGCCYGKLIENPIINQYYPALSTPLHPTQLYSAFNLLCIFFFLYFVVRRFVKRDGQLFTVYLILISFERFFVDYFRGDQAFFHLSLFRFFSINQWIAIILALIAFISFVRFSFKTRHL